MGALSALAMAVAATVVVIAMPQSTQHEAEGKPSAGTGASKPFISNRSKLNSSGIDGIKLGMTPAQAFNAGGWAVNVHRAGGTDAWMCSGGELVGGPPSVSFIVSRNRIVVVSVSQTSEGLTSPIKTQDGGIGLGDSMDKVRSVFSGRYTEVSAPYVAGLKDIKVPTPTGNFLYFRTNESSQVAGMEVAPRGWVGLMEGCA